MLRTPAEPTASSPSTPGRASSPPGPRLRVDELAVLVRRATADGVAYRVFPPDPVTAAADVALPVFEGWVADGELVVRAAGLCDAPFEATLDAGGARLGGPTAPLLGAGDERGALPFTLELVVPLHALLPLLGAPLRLGLALAPGTRVLRLLGLTLVPVRAVGPRLASFDLLESTDFALFDAPERRLFDLQNPEEGFWAGTGKWRLRLFADWVAPPAQAGEPGSPASPARPPVALVPEPYTLDARPVQVFHAHRRAGDATDLLFEDATRRGGGRRTYTELLFDASHPGLAPIPPEGRDVPLGLEVHHALAFGDRSAVLSWATALPIRVRDPAPLRRSFEMLSAVGIDFGTTSTVAALYQRGFRSLLRLGNAGGPGSQALGASPADAAAMPSSAENPTYLLVQDHERLWAELGGDGKGSAPARFPNLLRVVRGSHAAYEAMADSPNAVVGELKSLPERVIALDQSPQLRDRERQRDFLLDEGRVRILVRAYAYLLGRAINRPGQDVYLHYWLTHPAKFDERSRSLLEEELRNGILLSIPEGIPAEAVSVSMRASEPEAFAAEVCPELAAHPALEPLITKFGELRFAVFDFGGGTLDLACGRFRPATEAEQLQNGGGAVIETLQVSGDDHLGGEYLTHELVWLTHQHDRHLPEMEAKEVPMMRPQTIPPNNLANKPHLYKRSLAGRQNRVRFERELGLERVKFGPGYAVRKVTALPAVRLDGSEVALESLATDLPALEARLREHLGARIRDGVKLLKSMLANTPWGGSGGDWREQGVVLLLAGNSSRSELVERALAEELGEPGLKVWRPSSSEPFSQVVLYETPARTERGMTIVGVTPKTAVALGALKIANREVQLVRRSQGFSYFLGDLRGFPPKFVALVPMGAPTSAPEPIGQQYVDFGRWDGQMPLRLAKEFVAGKMTPSDPRILRIPTGLPMGATGRLYVCVTAPEELALHLEREGAEPVRVLLNLAKFMR